MTTELKMKNTDYNMSLWIINIPYICLGLLSNLAMKKGFVKSYVYLSGQMFCGVRDVDPFKGRRVNWLNKDLCTIGLGLRKSFKGILACRFLMGCFEAGFVPGKSGTYFEGALADQ